VECPLPCRSLLRCFWTHSGWASSRETHIDGLVDLDTLLGGVFTTSFDDSVPPHFDCRPPTSTSRWLDLVAIDHRPRPFPPFFAPHIFDLSEATWMILERASRPIIGSGATSGETGAEAPVHSLVHNDLARCLGRGWEEHRKRESDAAMAQIALGRVGSTSMADSPILMRRTRCLLHEDQDFLRGPGWMGC